MSLWKDNTPPKSAAAPTPVPETREAPRPEVSRVEPSPFAGSARPNESSGPRKESLIASDISIEGKIEGAGSVRIAGIFKGDVNVQGDLTIEVGAKLTGSVHADKVIVAGELEGNVEGATRVELQQSGAIIGDVKAGSLTVAAGARMRGQAVFGWDDDKTSKAGKSSGGGKAEFSAGA